jgi:hypothetical protein
VRDGNEALATSTFVVNGQTREAVAADFLANPPQPHRLPTEVWINPPKDSNNLNINQTNTLNRFRHLQQSHRHAPAAAPVPRTSAGTGWAGCGTTKRMKMTPWLHCEAWPI